MSYGFVSEARDRIWRYSPKLKLIWILRHPVERAYSHYLHNVNNGLEQRTFAAAIEDERGGRTTARFSRYLERSRYIVEIKRFLARFPRERMHVATLQQLAKSPRATLAEIFRFLGVSPDGYHFEQVALNQRYRAALPQLVGWCATMFGYFSVPHRMARLLRVPARPPELDTALALDLCYFFERDNEELQEVIGLETEQWRTLVPIP